MLVTICAVTFKFMHSVSIMNCELWNPTVPWDREMGCTVGHICKKDRWTSHGMSHGTVGWDGQFFGISGHLCMS